MGELTAVSLFAGVGGFDLAMERAGVDVVATVEIDKAARSVLERRFPGSTHYEDVTEVTGGQLRDAGFVPERGVIAGGFPCQDLSVAGKRAGLAGGRSGLYWQIVRLVDELSPKWLVLENVPGLLSSNGGRDFGAVLGSLVERGYGVAYRILDAQYFGVAQRRRRVFIVGCLGDDGRPPFEVLALGQGVRGDPAPRRSSREGVATSLTGSLGDGGPDDNAAQGGHLVASRLTAHHGRNNGGDETWVARTLTAGVSSPGVSSPGRRQEDDVNLVPYVKIIRSGARNEDGELPPEVWAEREVAPTLNEMDNTGDSRATVLAFAHTQGLDVQSGETASALTHNGHAMTDGVAVRRLTPVECERLQGFPDGWTEGQPDSCRYKQMGNAVAVPCAEWIMRRLVAVEGQLA